MGDQEEPAEEAAQDRGGTDDGRRPLALSFDAQVGADFLEGDFHLPALQVRGEHGGGAPVGIGTEQGLELPAPGRVAHG